MCSAWFVTIEKFFAPVPARIHAYAHASSNGIGETECALNRRRSLRGADNRTRYLWETDFELLVRVEAAAAEQIQFEVILQLCVSRIGQKDPNRQHEDSVLHRSVHSTSFI